MKNMIQVMQRGQQSHYQSNKYGNHANNQVNSGSPGQSLYQNIPLLAESTIASHSGNNSRSSLSKNVETKLHSKTRQLHPYSRPSNYLSNYPLTLVL